MLAINMDFRKGYFGIISKMDLRVKCIKIAFSCYYFT